MARVGFAMYSQLNFTRSDAVLGATVSAARDMLADGVAPATIRLPEE